MALTIQQIQDRITAGYDQRDIMNLLADYIQANPSGGATYKTYTCAFKQTGTADPNPTELQNTTNDTTPWHRDYAGLYRKKISDSTIKDKCFISGNSNAAGDAMAVYPIADFSGHTIGFINVFPLEDAGKTYLMLETLDNTGNDVEYSTIMGITTTWIELRIYP